jgi:hypothetical protein
LTAKLVEIAVFCYPEAHCEGRNEMAGIADQATFLLGKPGLTGIQGAQIQNNDTPESADHLGTLSHFVAGASDTLSFVRLEPFEQGIFAPSIATPADTDFFSFSYQQGLTAVNVTITLSDTTNTSFWEGWLQFNAVSGFAGDPDFALFAEGGGFGYSSNGIPDAVSSAPPAGFVFN